MFYKAVRFLEGKKTHIIAGVGAVINFINFLTQSGAFNVNVPHLAQINVVLGFLGLSALRAAVKTTPKV